MQLFIDLVQFFIQPLYFLGNLTHLENLVLDLAFVLGTADLIRDRIAQRLERFTLFQQRTPSFIQLTKAVQIGSTATGTETPFGLIQIFTNVFHVKHRETPLFFGSKRVFSSTCVDVRQCKRALCKSINPHILRPH